MKPEAWVGEGSVVAAIGAGKQNINSLNYLEFTTFCPFTYLLM